MESRVATAGRKYGEKRGAVVINQWGTVLSGSGVPDQLHCYKGIFLALEYKNPSKVLYKDLTVANDRYARPEQRFYLEEIRKAGGYAWVVNSIEHVKLAYEVIDKNGPTKPPIEVNEMLDSAGAAKALGISMKTLERMRLGGRITAYKLFGRYRFDIEECKAAIIESRKKVRTDG